MVVKNMAASVLTRLKNQAKEDKISFQMILQLFAQEEFLRKLSASDYTRALSDLIIVDDTSIEQEKNNSEQGDTTSIQKIESKVIRIGKTEAKK